MSFEYKAQIPADDGTTETVVLEFKDIALLPIGVLLDNRGNPVGEMWDSLLWGVGEDQLELLKRLPQNILKPMLDEWRESEGIGLGESDASPASSTGTVRHSKPTSSETGSD